MLVSLQTFVVLFRCGINFLLFLLFLSSIDVVLSQIPPTKLMNQQNQWRHNSHASWDFPSKMQPLFCVCSIWSLPFSCFRAFFLLPDLLLTIPIQVFFLYTYFLNWVIIFSFWGFQFSPIGTLISQNTLFLLILTNLMTLNRWWMLIWASLCI